jgi:hypothetical protein
MIPERRNRIWHIGRLRTSVCWERFRLVNVNLTLYTLMEKHTCISLGWGSTEAAHTLVWNAEWFALGTTFTINCVFALLQTDSYSKPGVICNSSVFCNYTQCRMESL